MERPSSTTARATFVSSVDQPWISWSSYNLFVSVWPRMYSSLRVAKSLEETCHDNARGKARELPFRFVEYRILGKYIDNLLPFTPSGSASYKLWGQQRVVHFTLLTVQKVAHRWDLNGGPRPSRFHIDSSLFAWVGHDGGRRGKECGEKRNGY
jgi:hypothetical protein